MYNVLIKFTGVSSEDLFANLSAQICSVFQPVNSYVDTPAYVEGYPNTGSTGSNGEYSKSIYATNVDGWGEVPLMEPFASTSIPMTTALAQFKLAMVGEDLLDDNDNVIGKKVEFQVEDYKEAFYFMTLGHQLADQGFTVEVTPANEGSVSAEIEPDEP